MVAEVVKNVDNAPTIKEIVRGPYLVGGADILSEDIATEVVRMMRVVPDASPQGVLGGRGYTGIQNLPGLGRIFVKQYAHGGLLRHVTGGHFLCIGPSRSRQEYDILERVRSLGVKAPRPLLYVTKGSFLCQTWLIMEEIPNSRNLVEVTKSEASDSSEFQEANGDLLHDVMRKLSDQVLTLIRNRILHVDLHPGNVLVGNNGDVFIVDFDKAVDFKGSVETLRDLYLRRWRRAVIKHKLSPALTEYMSYTLRSHNEW